MTVLILAAAATITLGWVQTSMRSQSEQASALAADTASGAIASTRAQFEQALAADPAFFLTETFAAERTRICAPVGGGASVLVPAGQPWDVAVCGPRWDYDPAPSGLPVRVQITPPSPDDPALTVRIAAEHVSALSGQQLVYTPNGQGRFTLASVADLDLAARGATLSLGGAVYSGGDLTLPVSAALTKVTFAAEGALLGTPAPGSRYYSSAPAASTPPVRAIRDLVPAALSGAGLAGSAATLHDLGCAAGTGTVAGGYSASLCLTAGEQFPLSGGGTALVPETTTAYLLLPGASGVPGTVDVYAADSVPTPVASSCAVSCDPRALARASVAAGTHPGTSAWWSPRRLGTAALPAGGVVATDAVTWLGLCSATASGSPATDTGWLGSSTCDTVTPATPGATGVERSFTLVAGTPSRPADVVVAGPLRTVGSARLAVVATGDVVLPYWSRPSGGDLRVDAAAIAAGAGHSDSVTRTAVRTVPPANSLSSGVLDWRGSLVASAVNLTLNGFASVTWTPVTGQTPWAGSGASSGWTLRSATALDVDGLAALP